jgi:hypothetical protein
LLAAAAGGAAAVAANAAAPLTVSAVEQPMLTEYNNQTIDLTSITNTGPGTGGFGVSSIGVSPGLLVGIAAGTPTTAGQTAPDDPGGITAAAATFSYAVSQINAAPYWATTYTGVYGWAPTNPAPNWFAQGVWGDSEDVGVEGSGSVGVRGDGFYGMVAAGAPGGGTGLLAWGGNGSGADIALDVRGKLKFTRSGRSTIGAGKSSIKINMTGVSFSSLVFAVLRSNRTGRYVRAVVPTTGSFTIYLNGTVSSSTYVVWFVVN